MARRRRAERAERSAWATRTVPDEPETAEVAADQPKPERPAAVAVARQAPCRHQRFHAIRDRTPWRWRCDLCGHEWLMLKAAGK